MREPNDPQGRHAAGIVVNSDVVSHLAGTTLFSLLGPERLAALAELFHTSLHGPGHVIAREGDRDATLRIIVAGGVALDRANGASGVQHVGYRGYGAVIGERGVFAGLARTTSAVTLQPTTVLHVDRDTLWSALEADPETFDLLVLDDEVRARLNLPGAGAAHLGERPVAVYRRHWSSLLRALVMPTATVLVSLLLSGTVASFVANPWAILGLAGLGLGVPALATAWAFLDYWHDLLIVTTRRVIHVDRTPFVRSRRAEAPLERVQDVVVVTPHLGARLLGYGDVVVQTAGSQGAIRFHDCPAPELARAKIFAEASQATAVAQRERQSRILSRLEKAMSTDSGPIPTEGVPPADKDPADVTVADPLQATGPTWSRWLPRTRLDGDGVVVWRKHWWVLVKRVALLVVALLATFGGMVDTRMGGPVPQVVWAASASLLAGWIVYRYEDWRNDLYVLTEEHIIDVERRPLGMFGERRQARLEQIQDISYRVPNPVATLLRYGDVHIETAAETGRFTFDHVHDPAQVQSEIFASLERLRARQERADEERRADEMATWFREYHKLAARQASARQNV